MEVGVILFEDKKTFFELTILIILKIKKKYVENCVILTIVRHHVSKKWDNRAKKLYSTCHILHLNDFHKYFPQSCDLSLFRHLA